MHRHVGLEGSGDIHRLVGLEGLGDMHRKVGFEGSVDSDPRNESHLRDQRLRVCLMKQPLGHMSSQSNPLVRPRSRRFDYQFGW